MKNILGLIFMLIASMAHADWQGLLENDKEIILKCTAGKIPYFKLKGENFSGKLIHVFNKGLLPIDHFMLADHMTLIGSSRTLGQQKIELSLISETHVSVKMQESDTSKEYGCEVANSLNDMDQDLIEVAQLVKEYRYKDAIKLIEQISPTLKFITKKETKTIKIQTKRIDPTNKNLFRVRYKEVVIEKIILTKDSQQSAEVSKIYDGSVWEEEIERQNGKDVLLSNTDTEYNLTEVKFLDFIEARRIEKSFELDSIVTEGLNKAIQLQYNEV